MRRALLTCTLILAAGTARADEPTTVRVVTYNVLYRNRDLREVVAQLRAADGDLVALQETNGASERYLRQHLGRQYPHMRFRAPREGRPCGYGVLSKTPIREVRSLPPREGLCGQWLVEVPLGGRPTLVANVHLSPIRMRRRDAIGDVGNRIDEMEERHAAEIGAVVEALEPGRPTLVLGDLNSLPSFVAPLRLGEVGLVDALVEADPRPTWSWIWRGESIAFRVDYVFHGPDFVARSGWVLDSAASDHRPVVSVLELTDRPSR